MKNTQVRDCGHLQLRAEALKVFNRTNLNGVSTTVASNNYGQITSAGAICNSRRSLSSDVDWSRAAAINIDQGGR
jgi:hypothetical protein